MSQTKKYLLIIAGLGLTVYLNILRNTFVWDDKGFVYSAPFAHPLYTLSWIFEAQGQAVFRPLLYLYLNGISIISQGSPIIIHLLQLSLHIINAVFVFLLFKKFFRESIAFFLALIFAVHPIQVEAVSYMAAGSNIVVFLLGILAIRKLSEIRYRGDISSSGHPDQ